MNEKTSKRDEIVMPFSTLYIYCYKKIAFINSLLQVFMHCNIRIKISNLLHEVNVTLNA